MRKGCTVVFLAYALLGLAFVLKLVSGSPSEADSEILSPAPQIASVSNIVQPRSSGATVAMRASSGATVGFKMQNGETSNDVPPQTLDIPHLVLRRNGALTDPVERTLVVEVTSIEVRPPGVTVTLRVETQHGNPDSGNDLGQRIPVWRESRWIANTSDVIQTDVTVAFAHEFAETVSYGNETVAMPSDYFRYDLAVTDANHPLTNPLHVTGGDYVFLMENQWIARLPEVQEESDGAAPDELVVYYCDMFPFQKSIHNTTTWLPRENVPNYVHTELGPAMVEAFRVQANDWGFPWYHAWTSYRPGEGTGRLSVALSDGQTWFHGSAPTRGHSGISIKVSGGDNADYDTLTDGIMSTFHHELFHNLQRNLNQSNGGNGGVDGKEGAWAFFSEGTAVFASSVGQPAVQFTSASTARAFMSKANNFVAGGGIVGGDLNKSYEKMIPHHAAIYWRFLYEQCGGMHVIGRALTALYAGDGVDIDASVDLVGEVPDIINQALQGAACPFNTYKESLIAFSRAIYALRLDGGRCTAPGIPAGCGFYDPTGLYNNPMINTITYNGTTITYAETDQPYPVGINNSFGMDFVDMILDPTTNGQPLAIEFYGAPGADVEFNVQIWQLIDLGDGARPRHVPSQMAPEVLTETNADGHLSYVVPAINTIAYNRLGLIITRTDANEDLDPIGAYTIVLHPGGGQ
ncbi:MAG: hypothetical protein GY832_38975 [Chloroflexi bacterium]|nr:hypothetical protein [Chloroflexota bacterium]